MTERDYVLGTHDDEISRLGLQHAVWRRQALDGWMHAGFTRGQTIIDVGCGPGWAALDLAEIVGRDGRVIAIERSRRFLDALRQRNAPNIELIEADLDEDSLPAIAADGAWVRWVFAFVKRPKELLTKIRAMLAPHGRLVIHEYFDYSTWRVTPRSERFESFVAAVMDSWRASGGEPDIALQLPQWLTELGVVVRRMRPIIDFTTPSDFLYQWPKTFIEIGLERLVAIGRVTADDARAVLDDVAEREARGDMLMITPAVMEIVATAR